MALIGTQQESDAHDLVQEAMLRFVARYSKKPRQEWTPLFYRILQNQLRDFHRSRKARGRWMSWLTSEDGDADPLQNLPDPRQRDPEQQLKLGSAFTRLEHELKQLPLRQQQTVLLRVWEGLSVAETAKIMGCTQGSVKTHYSRAVERLRERLKEDWP